MYEGPILEARRGPCSYASVVAAGDSASALLAEGGRCSGTQASSLTYSSCWKRLSVCRSAPSRYPRASCALPRSRVCSDPRKCFFSCPSQAGPSSSRLRLNWRGE